MSFAGNLEDLAIVDVIQLLHSTRKSGTLCVIGDKGRSQLVFDKGFIVSANHYNDSIRIGKILVEMELISNENLQQVLDEQQTAGDQHKPLIGMLIEKKVLEKEVAYKGLECLIEMTIVEMVGWQKGTFTLDVDCVDVNDEYRYIPEKLQQDLSFDTQMVLMDALRIYDEKRAAGVDPAGMMGPSDTPQDLTVSEDDPTVSQGADLSADLLGLDSIDQLDMQITESFTSLEAFDPSEIHRQKVRELLPEFPSSQREELVSYLTDKTSIADSQETNDHELSRTIILYSIDELIQHGLMSTCKYAGIVVFTASTPQELETRIGQSLERSLTPILVFDCPIATHEGFTKSDITGLRQEMLLAFPQLQAVQLSSPIDYLYSLQSLTTGASAVVPRSIAENRRDTFITDFIQFLESFPVFIRGLSDQQTAKSQPSAEFLNELRQMQSAAEISFFLLEQISTVFNRCLTLIVRKDEVMAEKSFGVEADKSDGPSDPLRFRVSVDAESLLAKVIADETLYFDSVDDKTIRESIFGEISAPDKSKILLLPIVAGGKTMALIYADFGQLPQKKIDVDYLQSLAWLAGLALEQVIRNRPQKN